MVMTHHTAKANLEKGSSWPPEAIPYGVPRRVDFYYPKNQVAHLGFLPAGPTPPILRYDPIIKKGYLSRQKRPLRFTLKRFHLHTMPLESSVGGK